MADDHEVWQRYAGWRGTYQPEGWNFPPVPRTRRVLLWLTPVLLAAVVWSVIHQVSRYGWGSLVVLGPQAVMLACLLAWVRRPPQTCLTPQALVVRPEPWRTRRIAWGDVVEVQPPGRFEEHPVARMASGERMPLVGLPVTVAQQMAAVTATERVRPPAPSSSASASRAGASDLDLDGSFRRGPSAH